MAALGKFTTAGKVTFKDKGAMWDFIMDHKGQKFAHLGDPRAIWFSIEKTNKERFNGAKISVMVKSLVTHLMETGKVEHATAKKSIDADYVRGIIVYKSQVEVIEVDTVIEGDAEAPRPEHVRLVQRDHETRDFGVLDAARERAEFKNFNWDALMVEANAEDDKKKWSKW